MRYVYTDISKYMIQASRHSYLLIPIYLSGEILRSQLMKLEAASPNSAGWTIVLERQWRPHVAI